MDKTELRNKILKLDGLTNDEKSALIELLNKQKKYGLVWEDKPEDVEERLREELPVLIEDKDKAIINDADAPNHILIEGDNLEALTALAYTHEGEVDVIYIDPPYNTGNKDFVYNDKFVDSEDTYRHSKWLSFMAKRLRIAKQLLSDKGVIFISIDDNEQAQLKLLCDEVFGCDNFISSFPWHSRQSLQNDTDLSINHEYLVCFAKHRRKQNRRLKPANAAKWYDDDGFVFYPIKVNNDNYSNPDNDPRGPWKADPFDAPHVRPNLTYPILNPNTGEQHLPPRGRHWRISLEKFSSALALQSIFGGEKVFTSPKPTQLLSELLKLVSLPQTGITVLDFFAGSGTSLHATMQLNAEDGGHRKCILVTNNENNICEEVTYERNKRVINGYTTPKGVEVEGLHGNNLRYYRTSFVNRSRTPKNMRQLMSLATDMLCVKEDLYEEQKQFGDLPTHPKVMRYFAKGDKGMLVIYLEAAIAEIVEHIEKMDFKEKIKVYVFSPSEDPWEEDFEFVSDKVKLCALPAAIYNTYKRILPKKKDKPETMEQEETSSQESNQEDGMLHFDFEDKEG